jgi:hypothetical protein
MDNRPSSYALQQLENRVQALLCGRVREFHLVGNEVGVVLYGFARSYYAKQLAQHAVMAESQLPIVANEIEVR